ncbi:hypothetical protein V757_11645 [Pelistega indica]|uniref:DUF927 domain-containing protein n=1 Tax=Pelistega indica TaxID=1414851 RepID=V8FSP8_9BURK|nr:DUF927 domain-containing protein [Pelistega indica]ETD67175.1 hypothetical protein V757_11645 [Pelistega indica]
MDLLTFLQLVLPPTGIYCSATRSSNGGWINTPHKTLHELATVCVNVASQDRDVWYGTASYQRESEWNPTKERDEFRRTQNNVAELKALRLDIDISQTKKDTYASTKEALAALIDFVTKTHLPEPVIVSSGYGLHVYWPLDVAVQPADWLFMAERLRAICVGLGLKVDHSGTTDSARVLRPPQTVNLKRNSRRDVKVILSGKATDNATLRELLDKASGQFKEHIKSVRVPKQEAPKDTTELPPMLVTMLTVPEGALDGQERIAGPIVRACQQVREAGFQDEPVWHRMINLMKLCNKGDEVIHVISAQDTERYDAAVTQAKIDVSQSMATTCAEFNRLRPGVCDRCVHWQTITSPIQLGVKTIPIKVERQVPEVSPEPIHTPIPTEGQLFDLPNVALTEAFTFNATEWKDTRYEINEGGCWLITMDDTGTKKSQITPYVIKPLTMLRDDTGSRTTGWALYYAKGQPPETVEMKMADIHDPNAVIKAFSDKGLMLLDKASPKVMADFIRSYLYKVKTSGAMMDLDKYTHLGWGNENEFVLGDKVIYPDGKISEIPGMPFGRWTTLVTQDGKLEDWVAAVKHMFTPKEQALPALMFLHGFSAPLMRYFYGTETTLTFVVGETGIGKSTLASLMWSIWAQPFAFPKGAGDAKSHTGATMHSLFKEAAVLHNLPFYIDEATLWSEDYVPSYVYDISSGEEKRRLTSASNFQNSGSWRTSALATSNSSLRSKLQNALENSTPHLMRIIEFTLPRVDYGNMYVNDIKIMHKNYGVAGMQYARFLTKNASSGRLEAVIEMHKAMLTKRFNFTQEERYWLAWATSIYTGMELSRAAGLHSIDAEVILETIGTIIDDQRDIVGVVRTNDQTWLGEFLHDMWPHTVVVVNNNGLQLPGSVPSAVVRLPVQSVLVRANATTGVTHISKKAVRRWCAQRNIRYEEFINSIKNQAETFGDITYDRECRFSLGQGIMELRAASSPIRCVRIIKQVESFDDNSGESV